MAKYRCQLCGHIYDEEKEGVKFADLADDWKCPMCSAPKSMFELVEDESSTGREIQAEKEKSSNDNKVENLMKLKKIWLIFILWQLREKQSYQQWEQSYQ